MSKWASGSDKKWLNWSWMGGGIEERYVMDEILIFKSV